MRLLHALFEEKRGHQASSFSPKQCMNLFGSWPTLVNRRTAESVRFAEAAWLVRHVCSIRSSFPPLDMSLIRFALTGSLQMLSTNHFSTRLQDRSQVTSH